jgi:hypothetical protein
MSQKKKKKREKLFAYRIGSVGTESSTTLAVIKTNIGELLCGQGSSLTNKINGAEWERHSISGRESLFLLQLGIQTLTNGTVSTISSDKDISLSLSSVAKANKNTITALVHAQDLLAQMNALLWNLLEKQIVQ